MDQPLSAEQINNLVQQLYAAQQRLAAAKTDELDLRNRLADALFPNRVEGTATLPLENDWKIKSTQPYNYKLDSENNYAKVHTAFSLLGPVGPMVIKYEPKLQIGAYKKLPAEQRAIIDAILTATPGQVQLEFIPPKPKAP